MLLCLEKTEDEVPTTQFQYHFQSASESSGDCAFYALLRSLTNVLEVDPKYIVLFRKIITAVVVILAENKSEYPEFILHWDYPIDEALAEFDNEQDKRNFYL